MHLNWMIGVTLAVLPPSTSRHFPLCAALNWAVMFVGVAAAAAGCVNMTETARAAVTVSASRRFMTCTCRGTNV
jgi:hypothetical protein